MAFDFQEGEYFFRCKGADHPSWLNGLTETGTVGTAPRTTGDFTGTRWLVSTRIRGYTVKCLGAQTGPVHRYLNGHTEGGWVDLAPEPPPSGAEWEILIIGEREIALRCLGEIDNPDRRFLDGRALWLVPDYHDPYKHARWQWYTIEDDRPGG